MPGGQKKKIANRSAASSNGRRDATDSPVQKSPNNEAVRAGAGFGPQERYRKEGAHELLQSEDPKEVGDQPSVWVRRRREAVRRQR